MAICLLTARAGNKFILFFLFLSSSFFFLKTLISVCIFATSPVTTIKLDWWVSLAFEFCRNSLFTTICRDQFCSGVTFLPRTNLELTVRCPAAFLAAHNNIDSNLPHNNSIYCCRHGQTAEWKRAKSVPAVFLQGFYSALSSRSGWLTPF